MNTVPEASIPDIALSRSAVERIASLLSEEADRNLALRIYVTGGGCSGLQYGFAFEGEAAEDDHRVECQGARILVDPMSLQYLAGARIDFEEGLEGARFVIQNPNATTSCGCGKSFSV